MRLQGVISVIGASLSVVYASDWKGINSALENRAEKLLMRQFVWSAQIQDFITEEHRQMMTGMLEAMVEQSPNAQLSIKPNPQSLPQVFQYTTRYQVCRSPNRLIVRFGTQSPIATDQVESRDAPRLVSENIYYSEGATGVLVEQELAVKGTLPAEVHQPLTLSKEAKVARYSKAPYYLCDSFQRDLTPPDFALLAGVNPLYMLWADPEGWEIRSHTTDTVMLEREGAPPGLGGMRLRVKLWLRIDKGYCPSRVELWHGDDAHESMRRAPKEIWNVTEFAQVNGAWVPKAFSHESYPQPDIDTQGKIYSRWGRWLKRLFRLSQVGTCKEPQLKLSSDVGVADFRLGKTDMVIGHYDKGVAYKWGDFGRLATEAELQRLYAEQYSEPPRLPWWRTALMYAPPFLLILGGAYWLYRRKRLQRFGNEL